VHRTPKNVSVKARANAKCEGTRITTVVTIGGNSNIDNNSRFNQETEQTYDTRVNQEARRRAANKKCGASPKKAKLVQMTPQGVVTANTFLGVDTQ
jgi:hypothetical protein